MKSFTRLFAGALFLTAAIFLITNITVPKILDDASGRQYRVEINRKAAEIAENGLDSVDISECTYLNGIERVGESAAEIYESDSDYMLREIDGETYIFYYKYTGSNTHRITVCVNIILAVMSAAVIVLLIYLRSRIISPFEQIKELPIELSKGNLTIPVKESKSRFFGKFLWGIDMLRESIEQRKQKELDLQKEKKTLLLSLSHDIKTPLGAIKLYAKALSKGLYQDKAKQRDIAESINDKACEIESYVNRIISASREDFLKLEVNSGEFYLDDVMERIAAFYKEKLSLIGTEFIIEDFSNCMLSGDPDRTVEAIQNIIENAVKYGDGRFIKVSFSEEDDCRLIAIGNSGCTLPDIEINHIFESFYRGSNTENKNGNGLGLYICRRLMSLMGGDIFSEIRDGWMYITLVFAKP